MTESASNTLPFLSVTNTVVVVAGSLSIFTGSATRGLFFFSGLGSGSSLGFDSGFSAVSLGINRSTCPLVLRTERRRTASSPRKRRDCRRGIVPEGGIELNTGVLFVADVAVSGSARGFFLTGEGRFGVIFLVGCSITFLRVRG